MIELCRYSRHRLNSPCSAEGRAPSLIHPNSQLQAELLSLRSRQATQPADAPLPPDLNRRSCRVLGGWRVTLFRSRDLLHATSGGSAFFRLQGTTSVGGNDKGGLFICRGQKNNQNKTKPYYPFYSQGAPELGGRGSEARCLKRSSHRLWTRSSASTDAGSLG